VVTPSRRSGARFTCPDILPIDGVEPGTNILVKGPSGSGARDVALLLANSERYQDVPGMGSLDSYRNEGTLLLSADIRGRSLLDRADELVDSFDRSRTAVLDCSGIEDEDHRFDHYDTPIEGPGDFLAIEMQFATLYETLCQSGYDRIRIGVFSISSLLAHSDLQTASRFIHMLTGRIMATGDLGVFVIDESLESAVAVDIFEHFFQQSIEVRQSEGSQVEIRNSGIGRETTEWRRLERTLTDNQTHKS